MKEINFNLDESPFSNFFTSRLSISARIDVKNTWDFANENNLSFFILSLGKLLQGVNSVPELRRRIIGKKVIEFDNLKGVTPISDDNDFLEMLVSPPKEKESILKWHDKVLKHKESILDNGDLAYKVPMDLRETEPIANFSCIPWVDFEFLDNAISTPHQIQPLVTWGKVSKKFDMSVNLSTNHIFVNGRQMGEFYDSTQNYFNLDDLNE